MKGWTPQAVERATSPVQKPAKPRTPPAPTPAAPIEARTSEIKPKCENRTTPPAFLDPETHLIGPFALTRAAGKHYPGRSRHVITGPDTPGLTEALAAALHAFTTKPTHEVDNLPPPAQN